MSATAAKKDKIHLYIATYSMYHISQHMQLNDLPTPSVLFENEEILALSKPAGWLTRAASPGSNNPAPVLFDWAKQSHSQLRLLHRLDQVTSGCILFAKGEAAQKKWSPYFEKHLLKKEYLFFALGNPPLPVFKCDSSIEDKKALTQIEVKEKFAKLSAEAFYGLARITTGRRHQIRIHLSRAHFSILGDTLYGGLKDFKNIHFSRTALHASRLTLPNPKGKSIEIEAPLPEDFLNWLTLLRQL